MNAAAARLVPLSASPCSSLLTHTHTTLAPCPASPPVPPQQRFSRPHLQLSHCCVLIAASSAPPQLRALAAQGAAPLTPERRRQPRQRPPLASLPL
ncbi:hypothetical protein FA09DRAFT_329257 [Tilletiopsis washingtonensis]|uniref:Uncharacterized protein n=1 Tax=Tilletiopsis washingtonensis TaxID=58919 RepID=A0A316ZB02_9BASI|nr:hypothetical protein FA09DRAFT_329257 [Tilletiopsis washingtonensis]PWN98761.1 hypothetical protein FA09DRAFT_329257 [Tilletiopsis washingtonensis]